MGSWNSTPQIIDYSYKQLTGMIHDYIDENFHSTQANRWSFNKKDSVSIVYWQGDDSKNCMLLSKIDWPLKDPIKTLEVGHHYCYLYEGEKDEYIYDYDTSEWVGNHPNDEEFLEKWKELLEQSEEHAQSKTEKLSGGLEMQG
jgi:hypothetical protein